MSKKREEAASIAYHKPIVDAILQEASLCGKLVIGAQQTPSLFLSQSNSEECRVDTANARLNKGLIPALHEIINNKVAAGASREMLEKLLNEQLGNKEKWDCKLLDPREGLNTTNISECTRFPIVPFRETHPRERR